jgi:lipoprotein-anchoring transpeptidase ErfK/SrfK
MRLSGSTARAAVVTLAMTMLVSACAGGTPKAGSSTTTGASASVRAAAAVTSGATSGKATAQRAVSLHGTLVVRRQASATAAVLVHLPSATPLGSPRVLLVQKVVPGWVQVALPMRPNGSSGWVAAGDVRLETIRDQVAVDLSSRRLMIILDGQTVTSTPVAIGSKADPTPTGRFFVTDRVRPPDPNGTYGAFALGLSAHSQTLSEFGSGDGQIGIHGTNVPTSIGKAVSHGCIRVPADVTPLLARVPLGTPVIIT